MATGQPFTLEKIRAGRAKPGLMRQHLACVRAAVAISGGQTDGAEIGSSRLSFQPGTPQPGEYRFDVGSAGSAMLVLQTIIPVLMRCDRPSAVTVTGGTHNPAAPSFDMMAEAYLPLLQRMGLRATADCLRRGFYPAGGGEVLVDICPATALHPLALEDRGALVSTDAQAVVSNLPFDIARREVEALADALEWLPESCIARTDARSHGPGNVVIARVAHEHVTEVFTAHGRQGVSAEQVGKELARDVREYLASGAAVGPHLADQLLLPMVLATGGAFTTMQPTQHFRTNAGVVGLFTDRTIRIEPDSRQRWRVDVSGG